MCHHSVLCWASTGTVPSKNKAASMDAAVATTSVSHKNSISILPARCSKRFRFHWRCRLGLLVTTFVLWIMIMAFPGGGLVRGVDSFAPQPFVQHVHLLLPRANNANARKQHKRNCARATTSSLHDGAVEPTGSRYICLLEDYEKVRGAYFYALFDQLFELTGLEEKRIAFLTTQKDLDGLSCHIQGMDDRNENDDGDDEKGGNDNGNDNGTTAEALEALLETLESSLELETAPEVFVLDDWNPLAVEERFSAVGTGTATSDGDGGNDKDPTILWLYGNHNAFYTRHLLRTSGFDRYIQERSASSSCGDENENERHTDDNNCVFVGEGTGAACAWITMDAARARGDDPRGAPELQAFGLKLLGNDENGNSKAIATSEGVGFGVVFAKKALSISDDSPGIEVCGEDEVFVWAQPPQELSFSAEEEQQQQHVATNFIMAPNRRGTIERYTTLDPLPPLVVRKEQQSSEGVACYGEPSVDPSRSMQAGTIGDSEWCE